jgi:DNA modification methylase/DNA-directed RNA polymerase subunit RPC12/RpoP
MAKKSQNQQKERLFEEKLVPAKPGSDRLFDVSYGDEESKPVECLGMTFPNDEARRAYFTEKLREKLKDPAFRKIEGFPIGEDEDILALSDPPYYTACPNPFLEEFIRQNGKPYDPANDDYARDPFATDVSEGKNDPIYNAHSYHTKVPHKAIMRYILHYTQPGDVVFDGFCGTGMTGVAAQLCGDRATVGSLGYAIKGKEAILDPNGIPFSKLGPRWAIIGDLSPAAVFIAYNYNTPVDPAAQSAEAKCTLAQVEAECGWMYLTLDRPKPTQITTAIGLLKPHRTDFQSAGSSLSWGRINYTVWSDVFVCSECSGEVVFWESAVDKVAGEVRDEFACPHCNSRLTKRNMQRAFVTIRDDAIQQTIRQAKQVPVLINYTVGKQRLEKTPDDFDRALLTVIENDKMKDWFPTEPMMGKGEKWGDTWRAGVHAGITHVHHFYTRRNLTAFSRLYSQDLSAIGKCALLGGYTVGLRTARFLPQRWINKDTGPMKPHTAGTLYVPSLNGEQNWLNIFAARAEVTHRAIVAASHVGRATFLFVGSAGAVSLPDSCVDYVFTDPPFGGNLMYSELNFLSECWLRVKTNNGPEAIQNEAQSKGLLEYQRLMAQCFAEYYRVLKPGRWMTVEFHNSQNRIWTAIQEGIQHAGFVVCDVRTLDKQQGSFKQYTSANAVKQDLVISAYKPSTDFEEKFKVTAGTEAGAWEFVRSHLWHIPIFVAKAGRAEIIAERQGYLLFDRMVAFHVQRGYSVPLSASEFYAGLRQKFPERDGMYFLSDQIAEYDRKRLEVKEIEQYELFVSDEKSAIQWVRRQLKESPLTYQQLSPLYMKEAQRVWEKHEQPLELLTILEQNCVKNTDDTWRIPDSRKEADLEQLRYRALMKEFQQYLDTKGKLKVVRTEALRAGFKDCWQKKDYMTIVQMAKRVPDAVIQEDQALLMYFDNASLLMGE